MDPLLSIAIPTKDRYDTLFPVLLALLKYIKGSDYEVIVQDNSTENSLALKEIPKINDKRIKYFYTSGKLSVTENSELAIEHCKGEYLIFIGDDDLISPFVLQIIAKIKTESLDCLIFERGNYFWKDLKMSKQYAFHYPASLQFPKKMDTTIQRLSVDQELKTVLDAGGDGYYKLPSLYHGIVKREVMLRLKEKFGAFVPGSCPDVAIATALSCVVGNYGFMTYPVTITGASMKSAAGMGARSAHIAKIEEVPWLPKNLLDSWDPMIPRIWTGMTIYAQNIHEIFVKAGINKTINYEKLYSNLFVKEPKARETVLPFILEMQKNRIKRTVCLFSIYLKSVLFDLLYSSPSFIINIRFFLKGDYNRKSEILRINTVDECMSHLVEISKLD